MRSQEAIQSVLDTSHFVLKRYLSDLDDSDLLVRALPGTNHIAWQVGHLVVYEHNTLSALSGAKPPELPSGFATAYSKETTSSDDASKFHSKAELLSLYDEVRAAAKSYIGSISEEAMDAPGPEFSRAWAPTIGAVLVSLGTHELMHAGQFAVVRRKLGKPVVI